MKNFFIALLMLGSTFTVYAQNTLDKNINHQDFDYDVYFFNGTPEYFFCQASQNVDYVSFVVLTPNMNVNGFSNVMNDGYQSFEGNMDTNSFNSVYFAANMNPINSIQLGSLHIEHDGSSVYDVQCFQGKGGRNIEFGSN
jgi:hypothetical protein